ncbi:MAG TPA: hypothetical protein VEK07_01660 [Polyangiaceae bacterium]|nr:hypothetical protein [Polyangiaceae bacterium]
MHEQRAETELMLAVPLQERRSSVASLRPVGLSVRANNDPDRTYEVLSNEWDVSERRRRLARVVVGAVAVCGVILAAAGVRLVMGRASSSEASSAAPAAALQSPAESAGLRGAASGGAGDQVQAADPRASAESAGAAPLNNAATMGLLILERPAAPGHVWLDGDRLTAESTTISCGRHEIRVAPHGRAHPIDVPCGGNLRVSR